jgi:hypothetical protein
MIQKMRGHRLSFSEQNLGSKSNSVFSYFSGSFMWQLGDEVQGNVMDDASNFIVSVLVILGESWAKGD